MVVGGRINYQMAAEDANLGKLNGDDGFDILFSDSIELLEDKADKHRNRKNAF